jgi:hypothetical protein
MNLQYHVLTLLDTRADFEWSRIELCLMKKWENRAIKPWRENSGEQTCRGIIIAVESAANAPAHLEERYVSLPAGRCFFSIDETAGSALDAFSWCTSDETESDAWQRNLHSTGS